MRSRLFGWWRFAEAITGRLASPAADVARADQAACSIARDSRLFQAVEQISRDVDVSWRQSRTRDAVERLAGRWRSASVHGRIRLIGRVTFVTGVTTVLMQLWVPEPLNYGRPFAWALPLLLAVAGLCAAAAADPIARAWIAKRGHSE